VLSASRSRNVPTRLGRHSLGEVVATSALEGESEEVVFESSRQEVDEAGQNVYD
jgi:hypothetical protein